MFNNKMVISGVISLLFLTLMLGSLELSALVLLLIFVHEMGHYFAFKQRKVEVSEPMFTPFGAFVSMNELPRNAEVEAYGGFAGPLIGSVGALVALIIGQMLGSMVVIEAARWGFILNLFNLIPLSPLDGGRISMAIDRRMFWLGFPMLAYFFFSSGFDAFNLLIGAFIVMGAMQDIRMRKTLPDSYFNVGFKVRVGYALAYLALAGFLYFAVTNLPGLLHLLARVGL